MAKLPLIEIRRSASAAAANIGPYDRQFVDAYSAAEFMIMKNWDEWKLYIHGRLYDWPPNTYHYRCLAAHIMYGIDTDIAFYGYD